MSATAKNYLGRAAIAALIIMVGVVVGGVWGFGQETAPLKGALVFAVVALLVDRMIGAANRRKSN